MSALDPATADSSKDKKSKWRLSSVFNSKDKNGPAEQQQSAMQTRDSAYGGSDTDPSPSISTQNVPHITQDQADAQGNPVHTRTDARGHTVTVTTTTVTTTTTTTSGETYEVPPGREVIVEPASSTVSSTTEASHPVHPHPHPQPQLQSQPHNGNNSNTNNSNTNNGLEHPPSIPAKNNLRANSPFGRPAAPPVDTSYQAEQQPPSSPTHPNFSYPGRQPAVTGGIRSPNSTQNLQAPSPQDRYYAPPPHHDFRSPTSQLGDTDRFSVASSEYRPKPSTAQSIREAAAGIHGAGETLRGALNASVARHTGGSAEEVARHEAVVERGRREIETHQFQKMLDTTPEEPEYNADGTTKKKSRFRNVLRKKSQERPI